VKRIADCRLAIADFRQFGWLVGAVFAFAISISAVQAAEDGFVSVFDGKAFPAGM